ncbi:hypothetical protein [Bacillus thuringiensis]|uniref:hypothetical protein n=1 Tax=Bacillus thuringiensis TaxID=1428 RepID=UPI000BFBDD14|nr:hypothetical protein [Bacillus thuringiensis]PGM38503.1 hypothetical protein CN945_01165 [Bacillus thuringiensis]
MSKFYVGQKVVITDNTCGHGLTIGDTVELEIAEELGENDWDLWSDGWVFDQDDCMPYEEETE